MGKKTSETHKVPTPGIFHDHHYENVIKDERGREIGKGTSFSSAEEAQARGKADAERRERNK